MGQSKDPSPLSPDQIREAASALPEREVEADTIRQAGQQLPKRTIDPDSIRSVAEQIPSSPAERRVQEDEHIQGSAYGLGEGVATFFEMIGTQARRGFASFQAGEAAQEAAEQLEEGYESGTEISAVGGLREIPSNKLNEKDRQRLAQTAADEVRAAAKTLREAEQGKVMKNLSRAIQSGEASRVWEEIWKNPSGIFGLATQSAAMQPDQIVASGLASMVPVPGATAAASVGPLAVEERNSILTELRERGIPLTDDEAVAKALQDPDVRRAARIRGEARGTAIAGVDLASNLLTAGLASTSLKPLAKGALGFSMQSAGEAGAEALAQKSAGEPLNTAEILVEPAAAAPQSAIETAAEIASGSNQAQTTNQVAQEIRRRAKQLEGDGAPDGATARPLRDMDEADLQSAREDALDNADTETVQLIDDELQARDREEAQDADPDADRDAEQTEPVEDAPAGAEPDAAPGPSRGRAGRATPEQTPEAERSLRALDAVERARQVAEERRQAEQELGLGQIPEDPAPEIDARRDEAETDEQRGATERDADTTGDEASTEGDPVAPDNEPAAPDAAGRDGGDAQDTPEAAPSAAEEGREGAEGDQVELAPDARRRIDEALEEMEELRRTARTRRRHRRVQDEEGAQQLEEQADKVGEEVAEDLGVNEWVENLEPGDRVGDQVVMSVDPDGDRAGGTVGLMSEQKVQQFREDEAIDGDPVEEDALPGTATSGLKAFRQSLDADQESTTGTGQQGELAPDMGVRPETRPEEQVGEAVNEARERVRQSEQEVQTTEQKIESALSDADPETLQRLAEQTESERARRQLQAELERRGGTEDLFGTEQPQAGAEQDLFGQQGAAEAESTSGLERLVRRLEQREAGLEQAREELLRRREKEAERREQARDAQQDMDLPETGEEAAEGTNVDVTPEEAQELPVDRLAEIGEEAAANDNADQEQVILNELQRRREAAESAQPQYTPPTEADAGSLTLTVDTEQESSLVEATVTEDAVQAPEGTEAPTLRRLADEAGKRGKALETGEQVSPETAQALYRLAQEGYDVTRASSAAQTDVGVQAEGEPAFRIEAPKLDDTAPQVETEQGVTMGRAAQGVTRQSAQPARSDEFSNTETAELEEQLEQAVDEGNEGAARRLQSELDRRQNPPTRTTYRHEPGDLVAVDEDGNFIDRRAGEKYEEALAQYFAEHEQELREGQIKPRNEANAPSAVARASDSPQQVLDNYLVQKVRIEENMEGVDPVEEKIESNRYDTQSFDNQTEAEWRQENGQIQMNWLGGEKELDEAAQSISMATGRDVTVRQIVEYIRSNPGGPNRRSDAERTLDRLAERFKQLTGTRLTPDLAERLKEAQTDQVREDLEDSPEVDDADDEFAPTGDVPFQRMAEQEGRAEASELVEVYLRVIASELGAANVNVVQSPAELEGEAATAYERGRQRAGEDFSQPAMFFDPPDGAPQVYVIASDVEANARAMGMDLKTMARATLMHEVVAHKGLRGLLGDEFEATMEQLYDAIGRGRLLSTKTADGTPLADAYAPELETGPDGELTAESKRLLVEEYLARLAEDMAAPESLLQRIWRTIRDALQRLFSVRISESDLRLLLEASRDHLRAQQERNETSGTRFDRRASGSVPAARWMMVGTGATGFDQAQAEGRTFQGLDEEQRFEISDAAAVYSEGGPIRRYVEAARRRHYIQQNNDIKDDPDAADRYERAHQTAIESFGALRDGVELGEVIEHGRLFKQYPWLSEYQLQLGGLPANAQGSFDGSAETIHIAESPLREAKRAPREEAAAHLEDLMQTILHEIQHAIQHEEKFGGRGTSPQDRARTASADLDRARRLYRENRTLRNLLSVAQQEDVTGEDTAQLTQRQIEIGARYNWDPGRFQERIEENRQAIRERNLDPTLPSHREALEGDEDAEQQWIEGQAYQRYRRDLGEIEARLTQERRDVTQEERMTTSTELRREVEYSPDEIIVRFARRQESPDQLELFHDPESAQADVPGGKRNMVSLHNLDEQNIRFAVEQMDGHLPVPSVATVRYEDGFAQFGDITLLGSPELVDPQEGVPTFGGDAYTPTTPGPAYEGDMDAWLGTDLQSMVDKWGEILDRSIGAGITAYVRSGDRDKFYQMLSREPEGLLAFLEQQGKTITREDLPRKDYDGFMADYLQQDPLASLLEGLSTAELNRLPYAVVEDNEAYDPGLAKRLTEAYKGAAREKAEQITDDDAPEGRVDMKYRVLRDLHLSDDGTLPFGKIDQMVRSWRQMQDEPRPIDVPAVKEQAREQVMEVLGVDNRAEMRKDLESYWRDQVDPFSEPRMPGDTSKRYNLYNIVERMRDMGVRAAEGAGVNFLRALTIERFGSVEEMQQMRDRLTGRDEYKQAASRLEDQIERVWEKLKRSHKVFGLPNTPPRRQALHQAIADYVARPDGFQHAKNALQQSDFENPPADHVYAFMELVTQLQREPVQYFESKPQRAVSLSEFEAAIVPDDAASDVREMLHDEVGRVAEYEAGSDADRQEVLAEESARADVRFQRQGRPDGSDLSANPNVRFQRVFHGSPFDFDEFDTSEIGSGEGEQAFGWGLYFTEKEAIAEHYAQDIARQKGASSVEISFDDDVPVAFRNGVRDALRTQISRRLTTRSQGTLDKEEIYADAAQALRNRAAQADGTLADRMVQAAEAIENRRVSVGDVPTRTVYTVEMHGGRDPSEYNYVQWRKEGEAGRIRSALNEALEKGRLSSEEERLATIALESLREDEQSFVMSERIKDSDTGQDAYKRISKKFMFDPRVEGKDGQKPTSKLFLAVGIDGIKYRADGGRSDAFNYTVFDDNAVEVAEKVRFQRQQTGEDAAQDGTDTPPNPNALTADWSPSNLIELGKREFRRWFQQRSLLPESVWRAKLEKDGALAAGLQRVRYALRDFGEALEQTYDTQNPDPTVVERLNEALQNGRRADLRPEQGELFAGPLSEGPTEDDPDAGPTQAELFGTDPPMGPAYDQGEQALSEMTFIEDLPEPVREAMDQLRTHIDTLSRLAIKSGLYRGPLKVVVEENMGTYVTRQYQTHNEDGYAETVKQAVRDYADEDLEIDPDDVPGSLNVKPDVWNRAVGYMRSEYPGMSEKQILGRLFELLTTEDEGPLIEGGSTLGSVGESIYKRREDIPTALRELMGEYKDPRENYLRSMQKMLRGVTNQKFLNQVKQAGLGEWLRQEPVVEEGTEYTEEIAAEGSRTMQPLNGLYTTKEIQQAFEQFENEGARRNALFRHYMKAVSLVKANLTVFSFTLQMRNYLSAFLFGLSQGHWFDTSTLFSAYKEAHSQTYNRVFGQQDEEAQRQMTQKLLRLGVLDESPRAGEMKDMWADAGGMLEDPIEGQESLAKRIAKGVPRKAERLYRAGDNVHKIAGFIIEKARYEDAYPNKSEQEIDEIAAGRVRNGFPTYSLVPKVIRQLRRNPFVASFPSFFAEVVRNRYNTLRFIKEDLSDPRTRQIGIRRALGEITNAAMWTAIASVGAGLADMWDLDDEVRRFLPSWEKYSYLYFLPSKDGEVQFVDLGYLNPNSMFHEPVMAMLGGEDIDLEKAAWTAGYRAMEPFVSKEILTRAVVEALNNRSLEDGDPIANPQLPATEQIKKRAAHVGEEMIPRVFKTVEEGYGAWMGGEEGLGQDGPTKLESIISPLLGQNIRTVEMGNAFKWKVIGLQNKYRDAGSIWYSTLTKRGTVSRSELEEAYRQSLQAKKRLIEKAHKDAVAAQQLGLTPGQAASIMGAQRIDERIIVGVLNGRFRPRIDPNVLEGRIRQEQQAGNTKDAQILRERQAIAQQVMQEVAAEFRRPNDEEAAESTREQLQ